MSPPHKELADQKRKIAVQIADLSRLLGMMPSDDTIRIREPLTGHEIILSDWLSATRESFLKLSLLIGKELDIQLQ